MRKMAIVMAKILNIPMMIDTLALIAERIISLF
jgi:hypothetical protein